MQSCDCGVWRGHGRALQKRVIWHEYRRRHVLSDSGVLPRRCEAKSCVIWCMIAAANRWLDDRPWESKLRFKITFQSQKLKLFTKECLKIYGNVSLLPLCTCASVLGLRLHTFTVFICPWKWTCSLSFGFGSCVRARCVCWSLASLLSLASTASCD